jgi:hypothetical protein
MTKAHYKQFFAFFLLALFAIQVVAVSALLSGVWPSAHL